MGEGLSVPGLDIVPAGQVESDRGRWLLHGPQGSGKAEVYGTPILTPDGWEPIEKLAPGDLVIGSTGRPVRVYGVWDRGVLPIFTVSMSDGASTTVAGDHLWHIRNHKGTWQTRSTQSIIDDWDKSYRRVNPSIPRVGPVQHTEKSLLIPPYMMGGLLADGSLHSGLDWAKNRPETVQAMRESAATDGYVLREMTYESSTVRHWGFREEDGGNNTRLGAHLTRLGLRVRSAQKFIPDQYMIASEQQRRDLLAGLFDGDGRLSGKGQPLYHTTSRRLAEDVQRLIWSLGAGARIQRQKSYGTWCVGVTSTHLNPFRTAEHADHVRDRDAYYDEARRIVSIDQAGQGEVRCIAVEADDHLYVTKDYIVTHNTTLAATIAEVGRTLFVDFTGEKGIRSFQEAPYADNIEVARPNSITALDDLFWALNAGGHGYRAVVLDSLTAIQKMTMRYLLGHDETAVREIRQGTAPADIRTWGQALDVMTDTATFWYGLADGDRSEPMHVVMTAQTKITEDEEHNPRRTPDVQKGALSITLAAPDYILYCDVENNLDAMADDSLPPTTHIVRFGANPEYRTKARLPYNLRGKIPPVLGRRQQTSLTQLSRILGIGGLPTGKKKQVSQGAGKE